MLEPIVRCPFCAHQQRVPDGMLQQLRDYRERFAQQQVQADGAAADAESWQNYSRTAPAPISGATLFLAQFVLRLPLGIGPLADKAFGITVTKAGIVAMYAPAVGGPCLLALYWYARGSASAPSHRRRGDLRRALEAALESVARQGRGRVDGNVDAYVAWLNRHWPGPYTIPYDSLGSWFYSVRVKVGPHAGLAEINLHPSNMGLSRINVLLAAWIPGVSDVDEGAQTPKALALSRRLSEELRLLGCSLQVTEEGLIARMDLDPDDVECFAREPRSTAALMSTFAQLSRHAARLGAV